MLCARVNPVQWQKRVMDGITLYSAKVWKVHHLIQMFAMMNVPLLVRISKLSMPRNISADSLVEEIEYVG